MSAATETMDHVCREFGFTPEQMRGTLQSPKVVKARGYFVWLAYWQGWSKTVTARLLNRDRSTIYYHLEKIGELR